MTPEEFWQVAYLIALYKTGNTETATLRADNALEAYTMRFTLSDYED